MTGLMQWLSGKKTNLVSCWAFAAAWFAAMNGLAVDELGNLTMVDGTGEFATFLTVISAGLATSRASMAKISAGVNKVILPVLACAFFVGCAGLSKIDPETGLTHGENIATSAGALVSLFAPGTSGMASAAVGSILSLVTSIGKAADAGSK